MNTSRKQNETPTERLQRVATLSPPFRRLTLGPDYPSTIGLLLLILSIVGAAIAGGILGADLMTEYARQLKEWALPQWR